MAEKEGVRPDQGAIIVRSGYTTLVNLADYLADPQVKIRIAIAVKAALDAFSQRQKLGRGIATEESAKVLTEIVLDALSPEADLIAAATNDGGEA